eukprot:TRINITY_DN18019_c0_g2_i2.p1 TRINITY_DN18019_c0_g2~~TRINITY_DN18019_c0_g2_i2.p1  ORF type:complete len:404 (-),score=87.30 TRINITY_DN18019_c0_g2_i2:336-1547(-)
MGASLSVSIGNHPSEKPKFASLTNLACSSQGAKIIFASDEWFAPAYRMIDLHDPVFKDGLFTDFGKWMDGWESRRRRTPGHDWCLIELAAPGIVRGFEIDTAFFTGNNVPAVSIQACHCPDLQVPGYPASCSDGEGGCCATAEELETVEAMIKGHDWQELLPMSALKPGYETSRCNFFSCECHSAVTHLRVNAFPDGGIARLRVYGEVLKDWEAAKMDSIEDFALSQNGGVALTWSNAHYGLPRNCLAPGPSRRMDEGWETARNPCRPPVLKAGSDGLVDCGYASDWFIMRLGARCELEELDIDTSHFKGNYPESCTVETLDDLSLAKLPALDQMEHFATEKDQDQKEWKTLLPRSRLGPHQSHNFKLQTKELSKAGPATHLRITIFPDGGIARIRAYGRLKL